MSPYRSSWQPPPEPSAPFNMRRFIARSTVTLLVVNSVVFQVLTRQVSPPEKHLVRQCQDQTYVAVTYYKHTVHGAVYDHVVTEARPVTKVRTACSETWR